MFNILGKKDATEYANLVNDIVEFLGHDVEYLQAELNRYEEALEAAKSLPSKDVSDLSEVHKETIRNRLNHIKENLQEGEERAEDVRSDEDKLRVALSQLISEM